MKKKKVTKPELQAEIEKLKKENEELLSALGVKAAHEKVPTEKVAVSDEGVVKGSLYNQLVKSYKDYDKRQKAYIQSLTKQIKTLDQENRELRNEIAESQSTDIEELLLRRSSRKELQELVKKYRSDFNLMLSRNIQLQNQIEELKKGISEDEKEALVYKIEFLENKAKSLKEEKEGLELEVEILRKKLNTDGRFSDRTPGKF